MSGRFVFQWINENAMHVLEFVRGLIPYDRCKSIKIVVYFDLLFL